MNRAIALPRAEPAEVGVSPAAVMAFIDEVNEKVGGLHSMMLVRHGKVAAEAWWAPFQPTEPHVLYSLSKSFTSTAVGFAVTEGRLSVEDKVVSFFPDKLPATVGENLAAMRVKDLLTMSTGHTQEPAVGQAQDWVKAFLAASVEKAPGTHFLYNTPATHVLSAIVQKVTGQRLLTYLGPRLFEPLGIEGMTWDQSPSGVDIGGYGLKVRTEDIAKFGLLYLNKGKWQGKQLIPEAWVTEATSKQVSNGDPATPNDWAQGYGYQFWRSRHGNYRGDGAFGQYCIVMPEKDAVLAITSGVGDMGAIMAAAWTHLLPGIHDFPKAEKPDEVKAKLKAQIVPGPKGAKLGPSARGLGGQTWTFAENREGKKTLRATFAADKVTLDFGDRKVEVGLDRWINGRDGNRPIAARGAWTADDRFTVTTLQLDSPHALTETYHFTAEKVAVEDRTWNVMFGPRELPTLIATK